MGHSPNSVKWRQTEPQGGIWNFFFFSPEVFKRVMWPWHPSLGKKKTRDFFFFGADWHVWSTGERWYKPFHSKSTLKNCSRGGRWIGLCKSYRVEASFLLLCPLPSCPPIRLLSCIRYSLGSPPGTQRHIPFRRNPYDNIPKSRDL